MQAENGAREDIAEEMTRLRRRIAELEVSRPKSTQTGWFHRTDNDQPQFILDLLPISISYVDSDQICRFANRVSIEWFGRADMKLCGFHLEDILGDIAYRAAQRHIDMALSGRRVAFQSMVRLCDGSIRAITVSCIPDMDSNGAVRGFIAMMCDISEQKHSEEALVRERENLLAILDGSPMATFVIDRDHRVVLWNRACSSLMRIPRQLVLGKPLDLSAVFQDASLPVLAELMLELTDEEILQRYREGGTRRSRSDPESIETTRRILVNGEERLLAMQAIRLRSPRGEIIGAIQCAQDITEQGKLEKQLRQVQKMEAIGTFAGGIAHDFNNILMILIGYNEMALRKASEDDPLRGYLDQMLKAGNRAKDLVAQILAFSRQHEQERQPVEISPIIKEALKLLRASLPSTIEIQRNIQDELGMVLADPIQIHQVLMNLCANASHAMSEKGGVLEVSLDVVELDQQTVSFYPDITPGPYLRLTVSDTGHGIPAEITERIFDPFFTTKELGEGTGMGLAVVHGIVKSHGGAISVHSEVGKGTTFEVFFPRATEKIDPLQDGHSLIPAGTERILFVGEEAAPVEMGRQMLEHLGYKVVSSTSSIDALATFRAQPDAFDLVISDRSMPQMTGPELAGQLVSIRPDIPVILCVDNSHGAIDMQEARTIGIKELVRRPITIRELAGAVRKVLDES